MFNINAHLNDVVLVPRLMKKRHLVQPLQYYERLHFLGTGICLHKLRDSFMEFLFHCTKHQSFTAKKKLQIVSLS